MQEKIADLNLAQEIANIGNWTLDPTIGIPVWSDNIYSIYERDPSLGPINLDEYKVIYEADQYEIFLMPSKMLLIMEHLMILNSGLNLKTIE